MSISVDRSLQDAIREFQGALSPDQSNQLQAINAVPDAAAVITFVAQLDEENAQRRTSGVATRLYTVLESVQQFSTIIDTFVSSRPNIAALVWGSVKLTMLVKSLRIILLHSPLNSSIRRLTTCPDCMQLHLLLYQAIHLIHELQQALPTVF